MLSCPGCVCLDDCMRPEIVTGLVSDCVCVCDCVCMCLVCLLVCVMQIESYYMLHSCSCNVLMSLLSC